MPIANAPVSPIKSIQRGVIIIGSGISSQTATITAVNTAKAQCNFLGCYTDTATVAAFLTLTDSTTVTGNKITSTGNIRVSFEVIEWN
jgi:hypothetical protein